MQWVHYVVNVAYFPPICMKSSSLWKLFYIITKTKQKYDTNTQKNGERGKNVQNSLVVSTNLSNICMNSGVTLRRATSGREGVEVSPALFGK